VSSISAIVLTKNEENYIADCLDSLKWCDEVIVLDSLSTDRTVELSQQTGVRVVLRPFVNFADQRNAAIQLAGTDWIFFVDADERVTTELADEVRQATQDPAVDGWWIPTRSNYFGHWVRYGGFLPDYHLRLAKRSKIHYNPVQKVHEHPILDGKAGYLKNPLIHICYQSIGEMKTALAIHSPLQAESLFEKGVKPTYHFFAGPILTFFEQYFIKQSYRDGRIGLLLSLTMAYYVFDQYRHLWILQKNAGKKIRFK
jgi:glycosyltransferase involved in cell wall biosynthesis